MSINKSIFYELCNKDIMVNLYKLLFLSSHFSFQPNKRVFHPPTFPSLQPNTHEGKLNIFHSPTFPSFHNFLSFHFFTAPTKRIMKRTFLVQDLSQQILNETHISACQWNVPFSCKTWKISTQRFWTYLVGSWKNNNIRRHEGLTIVNGSRTSPTV